MSNTLKVVERLLAATNDHDIEALVGCFATEYVNETPAHPQRGFAGREQVRRNWTAVFAGVPDITARVGASTVDGGRVWTEWEMRGTTVGGAPHAMAGVIIFDIRDAHIVSARFYLEPVEVLSGNVDVAIARAVEGRRS